MCDRDFDLSEVPEKEVCSVPVSWLSLDKKNPRLVGSSGLGSDEEIIGLLYRSEELSELLQSISANGYLNIEPLLVLAREETLVVVEGNRRLAAIRLFSEADLADRIFEATKVRIRVPEISAAHLETLQEVAVYREPNRAASRAYIGFKHINGAAKWESYAKAKFAADWYQGGGVTLSDIAERIGDKHDTIKRMVNAIYVLEQAGSSGRFSLDDRSARRFNFSHLYTALSRSTYMEFLGLDPAWVRYDPQPNPIGEEKLDQLGEVLRWIYGSETDGINPVVASQNPDIKRLGEVLTSSEGLTVLRTTGSLIEAHASIFPADQKLSEALVGARAAIRDASNNLRGFDGNDQSLIDIAEDVSETAQAVHARMQKKKLDMTQEG